MMAGYKAGKGFYLSNQLTVPSASTISGQLQTRWVINNNPDPVTGFDPSTGQADNINSNSRTWGFQVRRATRSIPGQRHGPHLDLRDQRCLRRS